MSCKLFQLHISCAKYDTWRNRKPAHMDAVNKRYEEQSINNLKLQQLNKRINAFEMNVRCVANRDK